MDSESHFCVAAKAHSSLTVAHLAGVNLVLECKRNGENGIRAKVDHPGWPTIARMHFLCSSEPWNTPSCRMLRPDSVSEPRQVIFPVPCRRAVLSRGCAFLSEIPCPLDSPVALGLQLFPSPPRPSSLVATAHRTPLPDQRHPTRPPFATTRWSEVTPRSAATMESRGIPPSRSIP